MPKRCNDTCWTRYSPFEAQRIKGLLGLPDNGGIPALKKALAFRMYATINRQSVEEIDDDTIIFRMNDCRVQAARKRRGLADYPCKSAKGWLNIPISQQPLIPGSKPNASGVRPMITLKTGTAPGSLPLSILEEDFAWKLKSMGIKINGASGYDPMVVKAMRHGCKLLLGVTGGIGSGKTTVANMLGAKGARIVDFDLLAREVVEPGTVGFDRHCRLFRHPGRGRRRHP